MTDLVELIIESFLGQIFSIDIKNTQNRIIGVAIHSIFYIGLGYLFIIRSQLKKVSEINITKLPVILYWLVIFVIAIICIWFGFEVWPALFILIFFIRAFDNKDFGLFGHIPGIKNLPEYCKALKKVFIAFYTEKQKSNVNVATSIKNNDFWKNYKTTADFKRAKEQAVTFIVFAIAIPGFWIALINAILVQPIFILISDGKLSDLPMKLFIDLGTGIFIQLFFIGFTLLFVLEIFGEAYAKQKSPSANEIIETRQDLDKYFKEIISGHFGLIIKMLFIIIIGGLGTAFHLINLL